MMGGSTPEQAGLVTLAASTEGSFSGSNVSTTSDQVTGGEPSHLDSFFAQSNWTREDILVLSAGLNVLIVGITLLTLLQE